MKFVRGPWFLPAVIAIGLALSAIVTAWTGVPGISSQDEPSYLLAADTFAHGRLTNPTHPMWRHFQTFHTLHVPTYMSKYQPAQGMFLALGTLVAGEAIIGAWLAGALSLGAIAWALKQWLPARWALVGTLIALLHPLLTLTWPQTYWGGSVATMGGALLAGAAIRLWRRSNARDAVILSLGLVLLGFSRPYEGGLFSLMFFAPLVIRIARQRKGGARRKMALAVSVILGVALAWQGFYDHRITGSVWRLPYMEYEAQYNPVPLFVWQNLRHVAAWETPNMRTLYTGETRLYEYRRTTAGFIVNLRDKAAWVYDDYVVDRAPALFVGLAGILLAWRRRRVRVAVGVTAVMFGVVLLNNATMSHYVAPAVVLFVFLVTAGLRELARWRVGRWLVMGTMTVYAVMFYQAFTRRPAIVASQWSQQRKVITEAAEREGGTQLMLVRYIGDWNPGREWVFNSADIDAQRTVWAHDFGRERNREILDYYKGRKVWLVTLSPDGIKVEPYS